MLGFVGAVGKNVTVDIRKMDVLLHGAAATSWRPQGLQTNFWWSLPNAT